MFQYSQGVWKFIGVRALYVLCVVLASRGLEKVTQDGLIEKICIDLRYRLKETNASYFLLSNSIPKKLSHLWWLISFLPASVRPSPSPQPG